MCGNDFYTHFRMRIMYSAFSETIRLILFFVARTALSLAMNGFRYHGITLNKQLNCYVVEYTFNKQTCSERCTEFARSPYTKALSSKQLSELIDKISENKVKNKTYSLRPLDELLGIFTVEDHRTNFTNERLLSDIISDSKLLENLNADSIKSIINSAIVLSNSGYGISHSTTEDSQNSLIENLAIKAPAFRVVK